VEELQARRASSEKSPELPGLPAFSRIGSGSWPSTRRRFPAAHVALGFELKGELRKDLLRQAFESGVERLGPSLPSASIWRKGSSGGRLSSAADIVSSPKLLPGTGR
jgi:hypothetical protein